ncbi:MAG: hypothetical protein ACREDN_10290 [Aestuariivirga sp.]
MHGYLTRRFMLGFAGILLASCTAKGPAYVPASITPTGNTGLIYIYRPSGSLGTRGESPFITIGEKSYGSIRAGAFIAAVVPEGEVKVTVQQSVLMFIPTIPRSVTVTVVRGGTSYVRVDQKIDNASLEGGLTVNQSIMIEEVSSEEGQADLARTRQSG